MLENDSTEGDPHAKIQKKIDDIKSERVRAAREVVSFGLLPARRICKITRYYKP